MEKILVVGGAGYIGSYMCKRLYAGGLQPVVMDNLERGHARAVKWGPLATGDMADKQKIHDVLQSYRPAAVMHFAAYAYVGESMSDPAKYYRNNVVNTLNLLEAMVENGVRNFIFSSTCSTYGEPLEIPLTENHPQNPINAYGKTKLAVEHMLADFQEAYGMKSISLRYFNASGADPEGEVGEDHRPETHLIPLVLQTALDQRDRIDVFGDDYDTPDGTCIRDYIHIADLAEAHWLALERLLNGGKGNVYNLGNGSGYSVKQVIETAEKITGRAIPARIVGRRAGDPAVLIGSSEKARSGLGWSPRFPDLESIVESAWNWHKNNPDGYG